MTSTCAASTGTSFLPMTVLHRLDAVHAQTKQAVLDMKASLDKAGIAHQDAALRQASGQAFYNPSKLTLRDQKARTSPQQLRAELRPTSMVLAQRARLPRELRVSQPDSTPLRGRRARHAHRETTFLGPQPRPKPHPKPHPIDGAVKRPRLDNHAIGTID